jgi:lipopolysaccharide transport system ATP-binding protein
MNSNNIAIKVEGISKRYRIGLKEQRHDSVGGALVGFIKNPIKNYRKYRSLYSFDDVEGKSNSDSPDIVWALRDVSFTVERGEALGIIGRNGAGKSTLLKILARITNPTKGRAVVYGRISSLLEVGTGFHPELTGRENIYLNGTILGMRKREIDRKLDEIVDFSGVEKYIDTPVKRYSSGMKVRVAFAVAAYLEPEILIIDEVLAVGDAEFQKKCLGKMGEVAKEGRTVLFVSHNMGAITQLCEKVFLFNQGQLKLTGTPNDVISSYLSSTTTNSAVWTGSSARPDDLEVQINSARVLSADDRPATIVDFDSQFKVEIAYEVIHPVRNLSILYRMADSLGSIIFESFDTDTTDLLNHVRHPGRYRSICKVPAPFLRPGRYHLTVLAFIHEKGKQTRDIHENVLSFNISEVNYHLNRNRYGFVMPILQWEVHPVNPTE